MCSSFKIEQLAPCLKHHLVKGHGSASVRSTSEGKRLLFCGIKLEKKQAKKNHSPLDMTFSDTIYWFNRARSGIVFFQERWVNESVMVVTHLLLELRFQGNKLRGFTCKLTRRAHGLLPESTWSIAAQVLLPYLVSGLGMVAAGIVMDIVQVWQSSDWNKCESGFMMFLKYHIELGKIMKWCSEKHRLIMYLSLIIIIQLLFKHWSQKLAPSKDDTRDITDLCIAAGPRVDWTAYWF